MNRSSVRWAELRPDEFRERMAACPVVYLPLGLCEPHGHVAALGLDLIKADYYCDEAARRFGGIVAPSQGYHIHECGFHAPWLGEVVGEENPFMAAIPPHVMARMFLYQIRAFTNTGFRAIVAISGHSGGSQEDLRRVAAAFSDCTGIPVLMKTDPELVSGKFTGDHAGRYEISQLLAIRPELVDLSLINRRHEVNSGGRLAQGDDAAEATIEDGRAINEAILLAIGDAISDLLRGYEDHPPAPLLTHADAESIWTQLGGDAGPWVSNSLKPGQRPVASDSRWKQTLIPNQPS
ncbi:MAG: creatininase family protein [Akkermansiaceae bacterium]